MILAQEANATLVLMDDLQARKLAHNFGLNVLGCVGVFETAHRRRQISNLREAYAKLLGSGAHIHRKILNASLQRFGLKPI
jgi:predicted nucleic acid-binding protein